VIDASPRFCQSEITMMNKKRWFIAGAACGLMVLCMGLAYALVPKTLVAGRVSGREVVGQMASLFAPARYLSDGKTATVHLGSQTSRVTADQVELTSGRILKIPASCKKVELPAARNDMRVVFDGQEQK
jgi:hypothetical protein